MPTNREFQDGYLNITSRLVSNAGTIAANEFRNLGSWREDDVERYISNLMPAIEGIKKQASSLTSAYYKAIAENRDEKFTVPVITSDDLTTAALRKGVGVDEVYRRPFVETWTALAKGKSVTNAIEAGAVRAQSLASTEIQLAKRNVGLIARKGNSNIVGYIRTLTGAENCALCFVASTQRYHRGDLMPIHPGCDCGELPLYGNQDPGQVIDEERLAATHDDVQLRFGYSDPSGRAIDYRKIMIREHGELGPVLTVKGEHFTGPNDLTLTGTKVKKDPTIVAETKKEIIAITNSDVKSQLIGSTRIVDNQPSIFKGNVYNSEIQKSLYEYAGNEYRYINSGLRNGWPSDFDAEDIDFYKEHIANIDKAFKVSTLADEKTLYRATTSKDFGIRPLDEVKNLIGQTIQDKGFISTSTSNKYIAGGFETGTMTKEQLQRQVVFVIKAPAGTKAVDMTALDVTANPQEQEILLARDTKFKVLNIYEQEVGTWPGIRTKRFIEMEALPNE